MIGIAKIRAYAMAHPEVSEAKHFNLPAFKVRDKVFVVIQKGSTHAIVSVDETQAEAAAAVEPQAYQVVRRNNGRIFVGVRVDLAKASGVRVKELVEQAWRHKAPKSLSAAY
jgi:hypothetical protein